MRANASATYPPSECPATIARLTDIASSSAARSPANDSMRYGPSVTLELPIPRRSNRIARCVCASAANCSFQISAVNGKPWINTMASPLPSELAAIEPPSTEKLVTTPVILYNIGNTPGRLLARERMTEPKWQSEKEKRVKPEQKKQ